MQSVYYDNEYGGNVFNGYMRYTNDDTVDSGRIYVGPGKSRSDSTTYTKTHLQMDSLGWNAPKTKFYYNFNVAPKTAWPTLRSVGSNHEDPTWNIENTFEVGGVIEH